MRYACGVGMVLGLLTGATAPCRAVAADPWLDAAKDVVAFATDRLEDKVKGDEPTSASLKKQTNKLMAPETLAQVAKELKARLKTDAPDEEKLRQVKKDIGAAIDKLKPSDVKDACLSDNGLKPLKLPCIFFPCNPPPPCPPPK